MADNLQIALESRAIIDQAKGVLIERYKLTPDQAFQQLAQASMNANRKVREISVGGLQEIQLSGLRITSSFRVTPLDMLRAKNLVESGQVDPSRLPIERLPLTDTEEAFRRLERRDGRL